MLCRPSGSTSIYTAVSPTAGTQLVKLPCIVKNQQFVCSDLQSQSGYVATVKASSFLYTV